MRLSTGSLATMALFLGTAVSHMIMQNPVPFGKDTLNNSPLVDAKPGSAQSDYPCKKRAGVYKVDTVNKMAVGQSIELNFTGSASHGGGTCQISVSLDHEPDVNSVFKVIQTFEGGCPTAQDGNSGSTDFYFKVPKGFPNGRATLAWSWYNRLGNREIYMNCAPIEVSGGSDNKDVYNALPNMYLINLPTTGPDACKSADSADVLIPDPGQFVKKASTAKLQAPSGPGCAAAAKAITKGVESNNGAASSGTSSAPTAGSNQTVSSSQSSAASALASSSSAPSGMMTVTTIASASSAAPSSASAESSESAFPTLSVSSDAGVSGPASTGASAMPPSGTGTAGSGSSSGTCSSDGEVVCNGTSQFGLCNNGKVVWQAVATGTQCVNGKISKRSDVRRAHVRRHAAKHS